MKKLFIFISALFFYFSILSSTQAQDTIAIVLSTLNNPFFVSMKNGANVKAKELGYKLIALDSQNDPSRELSNVEDLIVRGVKAILINPSDSDAVSSSIQIANSAGIPILTLDRIARHGLVLSHIASDNVVGGEMAAKFILKKLGRNARIIQLEGIPGTSVSYERGKGFMNVVRINRMKLLASQPADFDRAKGLNVMENLLATHPDVQAVFSQNDEMSLGALRALQSSKKSVLSIGFDGTEEGIAAVKKGELTATIAQQPDLIGTTGVEVVDKFLKGKKVNQSVSVPLKVITYSN